MPATCRGCGQPIDPANVTGRIADGCPCNSPRGVNHGLVPALACTCGACDPEQTGSSRMPWADDADVPAVVTTAEAHPCSKRSRPT